MSGPACRVLIVDDESAARRRIAGLLAEEPDMAVVGESRNGREALADIERLAPDLVFLDMEMPELHGLEVAGALGAQRAPAVIFVTAHEHYARRAFDADAMDYLLKPFDRARFSRALHKARQRLRAASSADAPAAAAAGPGFAERLWVRCGDAQQLLATQDLVYVAAEGNYVRLFTAQAQYLMRESLQGLHARLDPARFRRIHRSTIVNLDHVGKLLPWFGGDRLVILRNGTRLTLSRNFRHALD
jgi:two-component system LytT family response regulator